MEYTIGEVSSLLNLSRDMIRYYEKQGAIRAKRNSENRYRSYDTMELFWLLEAMAHKSWGLPIGEIQGIRQEQYARNTQAFLEEEIEKLERETRFKTLLAERLKQVRDYTALSAVNIGNFWVQRVPACFCCHLVTGRGDEYGQITMSEALSRFVFSERMLPFFDSGFTLNGDRVDWQMRIEESWLRKLSDQLPEGFERYDEALCLCTHVDIGEVGNFDPSIFQAIRGYAAERGYAEKAGASIRGFLLGRGYESGSFRRIVRYFLPLAES